MTLSIDDIAEVVHETIRAYQRTRGEVVSHPWENTSHEMRESTKEGVLSALRGETPESNHEQWMATRREMGWTYGDTKDFAAKTHPCLVPYEELPHHQKVKDMLVIAVAQSLAGLLSQPEG